MSQRTASRSTRIAVCSAGAAALAIAACTFGVPAKTAQATGGTVMLQLTPAGTFKPNDGRELKPGAWRIDAASAQHVIERFKSLSLYAVVGRNVYKMPGAAGNVKLEGNAKQLPWFNFEFTGAWQAVEVLGAMPATTPVFELPLGVNAANTRVKLGAKFWPCNAFSIDLGNTVTKQDLTEVDNTEITGRASSGSITIRNTLATTHDWDQLIGTKLPFELLHGLGATNTLTVAAPQAQIGKPSFGEQDGLQMVTLPLKFIPTAAGNDELTIRV
ncbi:hypothetical protein OIN59_15095 [Acidovorax sp. D2M1]|uniref:Uncharacterized protein n=1 Tax=Acidovorax benzenivorans TaxID=2987520 RepID=A0ABT5S0W7_9BURK|nr:phage tail tube protein [Acidovorax benzenivorans]MDD2178763.1 hypothetical protein [Acidovorax benzenivorans]